MDNNTLKEISDGNIEANYFISKFSLVEEVTDQQYLRKLCENNLPSRYPSITKVVLDRLEYELDIIHKMNFDSYFLIMWDIIKFAHCSSIPIGPGRGLLPSSMVAYLLGITDIDPIKYKLIFERFLNPEQTNQLEVWIDTCSERSPEILDYIKSQYGDENVEEIGLLKIKFFGLRSLTVINDTLRRIKDNAGKDVNLRKIPMEDSKTSDLLCNGDTKNIFPMEDDDTDQIVKKLSPEGFTDLIPWMALDRPGPLSSGMADDYIAKRHGSKEVTYMHPLLKPILKDTYGMVIYQEQIMQILHVLADYTMSKADLLRRAMGLKKFEYLTEQKEYFVQGCKNNGIDNELADKIFDMLTDCADYAFNKSHAVGYAYLTWQAAYLKANYYEEFMAATLRMKV